MNPWKHQGCKNVNDQTEREAEEGKELRDSHADDSFPLDVPEYTQSHWACPMPKNRDAGLPVFNHTRTHMNGLSW